MFSYIINLAILIGINAILAVTLNFILGYAGIFSLAHAIFFGIGAYTAAVAAMKFGADFAVATAAGMVVSGVISLALALPALRVRGEYFVAASLGLQMLAVTVFSEWKSVTGGIGGLIGIPPARLFGFDVSDPVLFLGLTLACLAVILLVIRALVRSSFGRSLKAIRDDETAASALGKNVALLKTLAVVVSSSFAAVAGSLFAFYLSFINVESFVLEVSVQIIAMVIIGGTGTLLGPVIGAVIVLLLPALLTYLPYLPPTEIGSIQQMIYGLAMVLLMIFRPSGLWGYGSDSRKTGRAMTGEILLQADNISKTFGGLKAVDDVSFALRAGIVTTLVGPNGAGKTTLFNAMTGHLVPDQGAVTFLGKSILGLPHWKVARLGIGRTFQDLKLFSHMTVLENVTTATEPGSWLWQTGGRAAKARAASASSARWRRRSCSDRRDARAVDLSYAERKFLSIARIMASGARLWLLDEPASGLDRSSYDRFLTVLRNEVKSGVTICIIEHNLDIVQGISDRIAFLDQGKLLAEGEPKTILSDPALAAIYFGERAA